MVLEFLMVPLLRWSLAIWVKIILGIFLAPNPGICEVPGENHLGKIIFESDYIYPVLNDLEVSRNDIMTS